MCFIEEETPLVKRKPSIISSLGKVLAGALFVIGVVVIWEQAEALYSQYASETPVGLEEYPLIADSSLKNFLPKASIATEAMLSESQEKVGRALDLIVEGKETAELEEEAVGTEKLSIPTVMMLNLQSRRFFTDEQTKSTVKVTKEKMEQSLSKLLEEEKITFRLKLQGVKMATPDALKKRIFPGGYLGGTAAPSTIAFVKSDNSPNCAKYDKEPTFTMKGGQSQKATFNLKDFGPLNDERQYVPIELMYSYSDIYNGSNVDPTEKRSVQFPKQGEDTSSENLADKIRPEGDETRSREFRNAYGQTARIFQFMKVPHGDAPGEVKCLVDTWSSGRWTQAELGPCYQKKTQKDGTTVLEPTPNSKWVVIPTETCTQDCGSQVGKYITNAFNLAGAATMFLITGVAFATPLGWPIMGLEMGLGAAGVSLLPEVALWGTAAAEVTAPTWGILEVCTFGIIAVDEVGTVDSVSGQKSIPDRVDDAINKWLYPDQCTQLDTIFAQGAIDQTIQYSSGGAKFKIGSLLGFIDCPPEHTDHVCFSFEKDQVLGNGRIWENKAKTNSTGKVCDVKAKNPKANKKKAKKEEAKKCRMPGLCRISVACPRSCGSGSKVLLFKAADVTRKKCQCTTINNLGPKIYKLDGYKSPTDELKWKTEDPQPTGEKLLIDQGFSKEDAKLAYAQTCTKNGALEKSYFIAFEDWRILKKKSVIRPVHLMDVETELGTSENMDWYDGFDSTQRIPVEGEL